MNQLTDAVQVILDAEAELRRLLEAALAEHRYGDVAEIARLADAVARIRYGRAQSSATGAASEVLASEKPADLTVMQAAGVVGHPAADPSELQQSLELRAGKGREVYPRFERDTDRLIKIGWSKKERRAYEHRAPRIVISVVGKALSAKRPGKVFTMDRLLPLKDEKGGEIPSYQAYLVLAWLRDLRIVQRRGKEGYVLKIGALDDASLERLWDSTPARE